MTGKLPVFDYGTCVACELCDMACPLNCITSTSKNIDGYTRDCPVLIPESGCTGCAICQKVCPVDSITLE